jgi:hypothetical protein
VEISKAERACGIDLQTPPLPISIGLSRSGRRLQVITAKDPMRRVQHFHEARADHMDDARQPEERRRGRLRRITPVWHVFRSPIASRLPWPGSCTFERLTPLQVRIAEAGQPRSYCYSF